MKRLAVVIPFYNINFFESCLLSLSNQTNHDFRVYIGDDNSPYDPSSIVAKYSGKIDMVYKRFPSNLGSTSLVAHWARCIELTENEEWLMILGDDDSLGPECMEEFCNSQVKVQEQNINVVRFASINIDKEGEAITGIYQHPEIDRSIDFLFRKIRGETKSSLSEYIFRKEVVERIRFKELPLAWYSDDLAVLEFSEFKEVYSINDAVVHVRKSGQNISTLTTNLREKNKASFLFYYRLLKHYSVNFTEVEKDILFYRLEKAFLNDKKNVGFFMDYLILRWKHFDWRDILNFSRKFFLSIKNGNAVRKLVNRK